MMAMPASAAAFEANLNGGGAGTVSPDGQRFLANTTEEVISALTIILYWKSRGARPRLIRWLKAGCYVWPIAPSNWRERLGD